MRIDLLFPPNTSPVTVVALLLAAGVVPLSVPAAEPDAAGLQKIEPTVSPTSSAQGAGGPSMPQQRVFVDPATGKIIPRPVPSDQSSAVTGPGPIVTVPSELSTSSRGLRVVPNPKTGGGVMVDLQGRFQQRTTVTLDAEGAPILQRSVAPVSGGTKETEVKVGGN